MVRRTLTELKTALAGVTLEISFARFRVSMATFKAERTPSRPFGRGGGGSMAVTEGRKAGWDEGGDEETEPASCQLHAASMIANGSVERISGRLPRSTGCQCNRTGHLYHATPLTATSYQTVPRPDASGICWSFQRSTCGSINAVVSGRPSIWPNKIPLSLTSQYTYFPAKWYSINTRDSTKLD